jgi:hypothetical protein
MIGYHDADALFPLAEWIHNLYEEYLEFAVADREYIKETKYKSHLRYYIKQNGEFILANP